jgi:hypothetical protein
MIFVVFIIIVVQAKIRCATWWILSLFTPQLLLQCHSIFGVLIGHHNNRDSDNYSDGAGMAVATVEFI